MIREVRPKHVLVEAPIDFASHVDLITHPDTRPPVAIAALVEDRGEQRVSAYYPFCVHAPEYVALVEARAVGAAVRLIDLPAASTVKRRTKSADAPLDLTDEHVFESGDYIAAMCRHTGCRDGFELWDHLFETRLGVADWRGFLGDVGAYCAALRASTPPAQIERDGDADREAHMGACVLEALADGGNVVVIVGGFHAPALLDIVRSGASRKRAADGGEARSFLIRYGFASLDALSGYAAGLPQPAYYDFLWRRANESAMVVAVAITLMATVFHLTSNTAFEMLSLSQGYAAATTEAQRAMFLAAGEATLAAYNGTAFHVSYILGYVAKIVIGAVMLRSSVFGKPTAYIGIVAGLVGFGIYVPSIGLFLSILSVLLIAVWNFLIARGLFRLGQDVSNDGRS
jgi:hypothetical protein